MDNPFPIHDYTGPEYFCDRANETASLIEAVRNGRNVTLFSKRRMGKTGLLRHLIRTLAAEGIQGIYIDIFPTQSTGGLMNTIGTELLHLTETWPEKAGRMLREALLSLRPRITYDPVSGQPAVEFLMQDDRTGPALAEVLRKIDSLGHTVLIAIDEFQQITRYPERDTEALLRSIIQDLRNVRFIFSGSETGLLTSMFTDSARPFYQSAQMLHLGPIDRAMYGPFILQWMQHGGKMMDADALDRVFELTQVHTYYVQAICNRLYAKDVTRIDVKAVNEVLTAILAENDYVCHSYRLMLTNPQWNTLRAVAHEGRLFSPAASAFLRRYNLGAASTVRRSIESLSASGFLVQDVADGRQYLEVQDVFLALWLRGH